MAVHKPAQAKAGRAGHNRPNQPYFDPFDMKVWLLGSSALLMPISKGVLAKPLMHEKKTCGCNKVIYFKYSKQWHYLLAAKMVYNYIKMLYYYYFLVEIPPKLNKEFSINIWNDILLKISLFYLTYKLICQKPAQFYLPKWLCWAASFKCL